MELIARALRVRRVSTEGVAEDPAGVGLLEMPDQVGHDTKGGAGAEARGILPPPIYKTANAGITI